MTGCVIAVLAAALLAYLLAKSWTSRTATDTTDTSSATSRQTVARTVNDVLKIGALLTLAVILIALMAVSVAHTRPHR